MIYIKVRLKLSLVNRKTVLFKQNLALDGFFFHFDIEYFVCTVEYLHRLEPDCTFATNSTSTNFIPKIRTSGIHTSGDRTKGQLNSE
jgi:hypothetical protein